MKNAQRGNWPAAPAIYQIYPRSFQDTTGTGIGDLRGITDRLGHVADLGVDAIWLSPFYVSPFVDGGYDIVDHGAVDPRFGTLADFDALVTRATDLGLRVVIDQVLNHTSCEHPWFLDAAAGDEDMADRYLFRDPKPDGTAPNNWLSQFGEPAWTWCHTRRQYYFHQFLSCQPSLNLRNDAVHAAHRDQIRFWRDRGVTGFRFDAVTSYLWDESLADNPPATPEVQAKVAGDDFVPYTYQDHVHDMLPGDGAAYADNLRKWAGDDLYLFGESTSGNRSIPLAMEFSTPGRLDAVYTTDLPETGASPAKISEILGCVDSLQRFPSWLTSHDQPRHLAPGNDGRFEALLMAVLPGPWLIFQGEELGLPQPDLARHEVTDPLDLLYWPDGPGREGARVPIPWMGQGPGYGFTTGTPWLPMRWRENTVAKARRTDGATPFYRKVLHLRRDLGWATGSVEAHKATGTALSLDLATDDGRFRAVFNYDGAPIEGMKGDPVVATTDETVTLASRCGAVWHL